MLRKSAPTVLRLLTVIVEPAATLTCPFGISESTRKPTPEALVTVDVAEDGRVPRAAEDLDAGSDAGRRRAVRRDDDRIVDDRRADGDVAGVVEQSDAAAAHAEDAAVIVGRRIREIDRAAGDVFDQDDFVSVAAAVLEGRCGGMTLLC